MARSSRTSRSKTPGGRRPGAGTDHGKRRRRIAWRLVRWSLVLALWAMIGAAGLVGWYAYDLPSDIAVPALDKRPSVTLLAADGTPFARFGEAAAKPVSVKELPPYVPAAVTAVEDARFREHFGLDLIGLARAAFANLRAGRIVQGGSTITQQLAKNLFLGPERTLRRKVQELVLALWLERRYTKDEILSLYLNRVYFGAGNFGIEAAARSYFAKSARELELNEAAMLAGLLQAPSRYAPTRHRDRAAARAAVVLDRMAETGAISAAQARVVKLNPARLGRQRARVGRYFADWALEQARGYVGKGRGDLVVRTTLDASLQRAAERAAERIMAGPAAKRGVGQVAVIAMSPSGAVRAMVGGTDYAKSQFNRATQALRQPGSAFKPFVYLAGLDSGLTPDSVLDDAPVRIGEFAPRNYAGRYMGPVTMTEALARSLNSVAVRILSRAGVERVVHRARALGLTTPLRRQAGLALGASEVTLVEMAQAYGAFANGGYGVFAHGVTEIRDSAGHVIYSRQGSGLGPVIEPAKLDDMNRMMAAVIERGTGRNADFGWPAGGKTGTTEDYRDAWFLGYSADLVTGVWMGNDDGTPMKGVAGGGLPARLFAEVMKAGHARSQPKPLPGAPVVSLWDRIFGGPPGEGAVASSGTRPPRARGDD